MVLEKLHCMVDRIEPTDLYDLCLLHKSYPDEFRKALQELAKSMEAKELIIQIEKCLEATAGLGTKESLDDQQRSWMESYVVRVIKDITFVARHERSFGESS
jgi:predicted nucleotidyltransferase component of viral defense system